MTEPTNITPFWKDFSFWNVVALTITLFFLIRYTRATERIAEYQVMPAVDVNMVFDSDQKKTYFWFSNASKIPALVSLKLKLKTDEGKEHSIGPLRIRPDTLPYQELSKTATTYDFPGENAADGIEAVLHITVAPAMDKSKVKFNFTKSYKFTDSQWKETTWAAPDPPFPSVQQ